MNFLKLFLQGVAVLPSVIQGVETLFGAKTGAQKRGAVLSIVESAINVTDALAQKTIVDASAFTSGLGTVIDGVVACLNASLWNKTTTTTATAPTPSPTTGATSGKAPA